MKLVVSLIVLLAVSFTGAQRIKGGQMLLSNSPFARGQFVPVGKGGGGGALHHTAVVQDPISGAPVVVESVSPIGGVKGGGLGAGSVQLSVGDGGLFGRGLYRVGQSQVPFGLLGMDYGSFPASLLTAPRGYGRKTVLGNNLSGLRPVGFSGPSKIGGGGALHHTAVVQDPISGAPVVVSKTSPIGGVKGGGLGAGSVQLSVGDGGLFGRGLYRVGQSQVPYGLLGMDYGSYPASLLTAPRGYGRKTVVSNNLSGLRPVGYGGRLSGLSKIGGGGVHHTAVVQDPISGAPVVVEKVSPIGGVKGGLGADSVQLHVGSGLFGQRGLYRVGQSQVPFGLLGLDYGSFPTSLLTSPRGLGKTIVSDNLSGLRPVGFGGLAKGGLSGIGGTTTIVQQEDPITGLTTTSQISQVAQDPIEAAIQESIGGTTFGQTVQSLVDPLGGGQTQVAVDDFGGVTQVKETIVSDPLTGELNKVTEVTKSGGALAQQNIADTIVQENIASGLGRSNIGAYLPRLSFLNQFPYDFSDAGMLRSVVSSPVVQQQQEVEQILVK